jgi:two-component system, NarL family, sensor histidine kinase FusK
MKLHWEYIGKILLLAAVYMVAARLGLSLAFTTDQVTTVWPPTGIALVALLLMSYRLWPGILLGAFLINLLTNEPWYVAGGIAVGNTLEALTGAYLLRRVARIRPAALLSSVRNVLLLLLLAGVVSTMVSASIGVLSLAGGGLVEWRDYGAVWLVWWMGDMMGALIFAPTVLVLANREYRARLRRRWVEAVALVASSLVVASFIFSYHSAADWPVTPLPYMTFPVLVWAALRFAQAGVVTSMLTIAMTAVWGTINRLGPFTQGLSIEANLMFLQVFLFTASVTSLIVAVVVAEREDAQIQLQEAHHRATEILAEVLDETSPRRRAGLEK